MTKMTYLDNAATTPVRPEVKEAIEPLLAETFANPSSNHRYGREARKYVDEAQRRIAEALDASPNQIVFTSGGTEADNLAVLGGAMAAKEKGKPFAVATGTTEHKAVIAAAKQVEVFGGEYFEIGVDENGTVDPDRVADAARKASVVSLMWVNNEVGTIHDIPALAMLCKEQGAAFHTDAVQTVGKVPVSFAHEGLDMLSVAGHKIGAPKGVGALLLRDKGLVSALMHGGSQQHGVRPGTENVAGAVALATAIELAVRDQEENAAKYRKLRDDLEARLLHLIEEVTVVATEGNRAPHISSVAFPGIDPLHLLIHLDKEGIACSSGPACSSGSLKPSHVLEAMGLPESISAHALRFSFYSQNTQADVDHVVQVLPGIVEKLRAAPAGA
ncbi:MAG: cysteine desulfurase [Gemmatimonadota bacterium]|nr:cysteine desulfurase [Gemmatimonadota bacterium]